MKLSDFRLIKTVWTDKMGHCYSIRPSAWNGWERAWKCCSRRIDRHRWYSRYLQWERNKKNLQDQRRRIKSGIIIGSRHQSDFHQRNCRILKLLSCMPKLTIDKYNMKLCENYQLLFKSHRWFHYFDIITRSVVSICFNKSNPFYYSHPRLDSAKYSMFPIQPLRGSESNEELRSVGVRTRVGHRQNART